MKKMTLVVAVGMSLCCAVIEAQQTATFDHVAVQAADLEKSAQFYEQVLGLKRIPEPFKDGQHIWFAMGTTQQLHLDKVDKPLPTSDDTHMAVRVQSVDEFIAHLKTMNVKWEGFHGKAQPNFRPDGVHQIYFQDPSGNWIEVNDRKAE